MAKKPISRDEDISGKVGDDLEKVYVDVQKGFEDQRERSDDLKDNWDLYNCKLDSQRQFYVGNSQIFAPFVRDAINARVTRFANQIFPQSGRYIEVTTGDADPPMAEQSLLEHYVRRTKLRTQIVPALLRNGDCEGQYSIYVDWKKRTRRVAHRVKVQPTTGGMANPAADEVDDIRELEIDDDYPNVEVLADNDLLVLPVTVDSIDEALFECDGSVTVLRRWSKGKVRQMKREDQIKSSEADWLLDQMNQVEEGKSRDTGKQLADAAGIKAHGKYALVYETWKVLEVQGDRRLCRIFFGPENHTLGVKLCPYWNDMCPVISAPVEKVAGVFKGRAPVEPVGDLQVFANDTINEGADTAHFSAMPIVMTDPLSNSRSDTMVLGLGAVWDADPDKTKIVEFPELWKSALERALAIRDQIFQTLGVNPAMMPQQTGGPNRKRNQAELATEQQVDILTTADACTIIEEGILTPLAQRFADLDHQFRDTAISIQVYGDMGFRANMEEVEPLQLGKRYEFRWYGVEAARNAAQMQQQIAWTNTVAKIPPNLYPDYDLDLGPMIAQGTENTFGPRLAPLTFKRKMLMSVDPMIENEMMDAGFITPVHLGDDDIAHIQAHMAGMQGGDLHGTYRDHIAHHQAQMMAKQQSQTQQQPAGQTRPGGSPRSNGGTPGGASPAQPRQMKGSPGAMHPDQMGKAGAVVMPRGRPS